MWAKRWMAMVCAWWVAAALVGGCDAIATESAFCDFRKGSVNGPENRCQERVDTVLASAESFKAACKALEGESGDGKCPRTGVVGGCETGTQGDGSKVNDWYYAPETKANVQKECASDSGKFLEP